MKQKYNILDKFKVKLSGEFEGVSVSVEKEMFIVSVKLMSNSHERYLQYGLSSDPTDVYHYGKDATHFFTEKQLDELNL